MAYSEYLADRVRQRLAAQPKQVEEKKMMGGLIFMVDEKMCLGVNQDKETKEDRLMVRVGKGNYYEALALPGCREMKFTGRTLSGFVFVGPEGMDNEADLDAWVQRAMEFNRVVERRKG